MIEVRETPQIAPICPHCEKPIHIVNSQRAKSTFGIRFIYYCNDCNKVLSISHRKGFWMG